VHAIALDSKYGVPTVAIHTNAFEKAVQSVTRMHGMPEARYTFVPQPVMGKTVEQLRAYVEGKSPISGRPVMQEVIEGLTRPAEGDRIKEIKFERSTPRLVDSDTDENLQRLFLENNWTDKLPIVLPTERKVREMLAHTSRKPDEVAGHMRSNQFRQYWEFTVEKVAVNAVMAGARPEYFPLILALASSGVSARGSTTSSMAAMVVVNGPIRNEIGMNSGTGAMAPYNHANATIGRAYGLLSQNLQGGSVPGETFMGSQVDEQFLEELVRTIGRLDIVIDDGSHLNHHVLRTFELLFPRLSQDGIYVIEDTQTSYWCTYGGSSTELDRVDTVMGFLKTLVDGVNYEEFEAEHYGPSYYEQNIVAIHFYHNLVFIQKGLNKEGSNRKEIGAIARLT